MSVKIRFIELVFIRFIVWERRKNFYKKFLAWPLLLVFIWQGFLVDGGKISDKLLER